MVPKRQMNILDFGEGCDVEFRACNITLVNSLILIIASSVPAYINSRNFI